MNTKRRPATALSLDATQLALDRLSGVAREDRRRLLWAAGPAAFLHLALLVVHLPAPETSATVPEATRALALVQPVRFKAPEPPTPEDPSKPIRKTVHNPIPVPAFEEIRVEPDRPLPIMAQVEPATNAIELDLPIPPAPPAPEPPTPAEPIFVGAGVTAPVKIFGPQPMYTDPARRAGVRGRVVVRATVDTEGRVTDLRVIRGLPMGLTDNTLAALRRWRFRPALRGGEPVAVFFGLTVNFELQ